MDDEQGELQRLNAEVHSDSDNFEAWEKLVRFVEQLEGGINRNSSPQAIAAARDTYDRFLAKFPLFFGYWKKYADLEFAIAGTEAAELVYERGTASIGNSVDLWAQYCAFKVETSHDPDVIRELFERGANSVGLDFLSHPFWDKYIEFEERLEAHDRIFAILGRVIHVPMHQYARYFERFRQAAQHRPLNETVPAETLAQFRAEIEMDAAGKEQAGGADAELRARVDAHVIEIFQKTQAETTKRWTYEQEIKRPYFHVTDLDDAQLSNWRKYLDFEEEQGDHARTTFLYERCLVAAAYYEEFWLRYARWMLGQIGKTEEVRHIYMRGACIYAPIARPDVRLQWALFEEMQERVDVAQDIYQAILLATPGHLETVVAWANSARRHGGVDAGIAVLRAQLESSAGEQAAKAGLFAEWARLLAQVKGAPDEARQVFREAQQSYLDSREFWSSWLRFEIGQHADPSAGAAQYGRIKDVADSVRRRSHLSRDVVRELSNVYMAYLLGQGTKDAAKEYMTIDREVNRGSSGAGDAQAAAA